MVDSGRRPSIYRPRGAIGKPVPDVQRVAEAISMPGIDPRSWVVGGTVGVRQADGSFDTTDP